MSVINKREAGESALVNPHTGSEKCFYCCETIYDGAAVTWRGDSTDILLHAECAQRFGGHLIKDGILLENAFEAAAYVAKRDFRYTR